MKYKLSSSILALLASIIISYAVTIEFFHTHTSFQHNCPICHFQLNYSSDAQQTISSNNFSFIQFFEVIPFINYPTVIQQSTSRSPPTKV